MQCTPDLPTGSLTAALPFGIKVKRFGHKDIDGNVLFCRPDHLKNHHANFSLIQLSRFAGSAKSLAGTGTLG